MAYTGVDELFGDYLVRCGFERMGQPGVYRATYRGEDAPGGQNAFISLGASEDLNVMCPIGPADEVGSDDLDAARDEADRCSVILVGSFAAFSRELHFAEFATEGSVLVDRAVELAKYTALVKDRLVTNQARKMQLLEQLQDWSNDYESVSSGRVSPKRFTAAVSEVLTLVPKHGLLDEILKDAMNENLRHWATSGVQMSESPWRAVVERLQIIKDHHGWVSEVEPDIFEYEAGVPERGVERRARVDGTVWDDRFNILGKVDVDGRVWANGFTILGSVDEDGTIWASPLTIVGSVDDRGSIWNTQIEMIGSVDGRGSIWNTAFEKAGSVDGGVTQKQAGAAAVLLGLIRSTRL